MLTFWLDFFCLIYTAVTSYMFVLTFFLIFRLFNFSIIFSLEQSRYVFYKCFKKNYLVLHHLILKHDTLQWLVPLHVAVVENNSCDFKRLSSKQKNETDLQMSTIWQRLSFFVNINIRITIKMINIILSLFHAHKFHALLKIFKIDSKAYKKNIMQVHSKLTNINEAIFY